MKALKGILLGLLISVCLSSYSIAANNSEDETGGIQPLLDTLNIDISTLKLLNEHLVSIDKANQRALIFRRDERSFHLLDDFDFLVAELANLPEKPPLKAETEAVLKNLGAGMGESILTRITEIQQRAIDANEGLDKLSGGSLVAQQAYINSLESIHVRYYEALVNHLDSRKALGLTSDNILQQLSPNLYLYAEIIMGRIEASNATLNEVKSRAESDPANADISATLKDISANHALSLNRLESIILVLDRLELDSSHYKAIMLTQSSNISVSFFSMKAIVSVLKASLASLKSVLTENGPDMFFRLLLFIAVLLLFRTFSRVTKRVVRTGCDHSSLDLSELLKDILVSTSGGFIMVIGLLMALSQLGISLAPMLAGLGVAGFVIGFALQDTLGNFAAGAMILIYRPYDVDDFVEVTGASGLVKKMNLVSTTITTFDNQTLVVPNSKIWGDVIKNVTAQKVRRVDLEFGIGYGDDIEKAERVLEDVVSSHEMVLKKPEIMIKLHTLGDSSVNFVVRPWVKTDDYWDVYWDLTREVKMRFDREGISIPFPQRDIHFYNEHVEKTQAL
ncbi:MAG: mechanosensitive ion channel family protein [Candidatus Reddybacter sp.]